MLGILDVSLKDNRKGKAKGRGGVEWRTGNNAIYFAKTDDCNIGSGYDEGGDCGIRRHFGLFLSLGQIEESNNHCADKLLKDGLDKQRRASSLSVIDRKRYWIRKPSLE